MILVFGEALIDFTPADCSGESGFVPRPGGSPYNVAVGLARLGVPTAFAGGISSDPFGRMLRARLEHEGVDTALLTVSEAPSPLAFVLLDEAGGAEYAFHLEASAFTDAGRSSPAADDWPTDVLGGDVQAVHVGSLALAVEPVSGLADRLLSTAHGDRFTTMDPNIRPVFIPSRERYRAQTERRLADVDVVKASVEDLAWLYPGEDPLAVGRRWCELGAAMTVLTRGADGAAAVRPDGVVEIPGEAVEIVDTVGAGDAFMSGLVWWLSGRRALSRRSVTTLEVADVRTGLRAAQAVALLTCGRAGADPPRRDEVQAVGSARGGPVEGKHRGGG